MILVFEKESKHEGNDCMIYDYAFVVEVEEGFVANRFTIYKGWFGTSSRNNSCIFSNFEDAVNFAEAKD